MLRRIAIGLAFGFLVIPTTGNAAECSSYRGSGRVCFVQPVAAVDVPPEKGGHRKLMAEYQPPNNGGPGSSRGSGTRLM